MKAPLLILGAGGHARVVLFALTQAGGRKIEGVLDADPSLWGKSVDGAKVLGGDALLDKRKTSSVLLVNGVGADASTAARRALYERCKAKGFSFHAVVSPSAERAKSAEVREGAQVLTRAVLHPGCVIGENAVVNTGAIVEHDAKVGAHAFVGPAAVLCGAAIVGEGAFVGAAAVVLPGVKIGPGAVVAAGAVVTQDLSSGVKAAGVPARAV